MYVFLNYIYYNLVSILERSSSANKTSSNNPTIVKSSYKHSLNQHELSNILDRSVTPNFLNKDIDFLNTNRSPAKNPF